MNKSRPGLIFIVHDAYFFIMIVSPTIKTRLFLTANGLVAGVVLLLGWAVARMSDRAVEERLLKESSANAARLVERLNLPYSNRLARDLAVILGGKVVIWQEQNNVIIASSLSEDERAFFQSFVFHDQKKLVMNGETFFMGSTRLWPADERETARHRLAVLLSENQLRIAQREVRRGLPWVAAGVMILASLIAYGVARGIYGPIGRMSGWVNDMADYVRDGGKITFDSGAGGGASAVVHHADPPELRRLAADVDSFLIKMATLQKQSTREENLAAVGRFSMAVAHELRNPLGGIRMNAQLIENKMKKETGSVDRGVEMIIAETHRMEFILNELLGILDADKPVDCEAPPVSCRLSATIVRVLEFMRPRFHGADIDIHWTALDPDVDFPCSAVELEQILYNLLANAIDAMPEGGVIDLNWTAGAGGDHRLTVSDSGDGKGLLETEDIFNPFVTSKKRGAGLGLYVCRRIVERRGGAITVRRADDRTIFTVNFPMKKD
ncbi:MAG: HAMP domain-containing sensor histidine kinase [Lentisphaeria bacterium]|nr:HAMP domain-containing sensor histidine kinase [Lentisphaeria bacterium]